MRLSIMIISPLKYITASGNILRLYHTLPLKSQNYYILIKMSHKSLFLYLYSINSYIYYLANFSKIKIIKMLHLLLAILLMKISKRACLLFLIWFKILFVNFIYHCKIYFAHMTTSWYLFYHSLKTDIAQSVPVDSISIAVNLTCKLDK